MLPKRCRGIWKTMSVTESDFKISNKKLAGPGKNWNNWMDLSILYTNSQMRSTTSGLAQSIMIVEDDPISMFRNSGILRRRRVLCTGCVPPSLSTILESGWRNKLINFPDYSLVHKKQARKSSEDTHFTGYARFEKVWAR